MTVIFAAMSVALIGARWGPRWVAMTALLACLALSIAEFLYEIYDPQDGFRLPWLQVLLRIVVVA